MDVSIVTAVLSFLSPLVYTIVKFKDEKKKRVLELKNIELENENLRLQNKGLSKTNKDYEIKLQFFDRIMDLQFINAIGDSVEKMFEKTKADRFLILIAKNGKEDFNIVSVIFEQHKNSQFKINAIARYRNVHIDNEYRKLLKDSERYGVVEIETDKMQDSILKDFYTMEGVKFSKVRHLARKPIDEENDFLVFSSLSTHNDEDFNKIEKAFIKTQYEGTIMPSLNEVLK